jgi:hypothetical protein
MSTGLFPTVRMPADCFFEILSHLDAQDIGRCCKVNKQWSKLASDDRLWKRLFPEIPFSSSGVSAKEYINRYAVISKNAVVKRIQKFFDTIPLDKKGTFECFFPLNPKCTIKVALGRGKINSQGESDLEEKCIYMTRFDRAPEDIQSTISGCDAHDEEGSSIFYNRLELPIATEKENNDIANQINAILVARLSKLIAEVDSKTTQAIQLRNNIINAAQRRNKIIYCGIAAAVAALAVAVNMYLNAANPDEQP